MASGTEARRTRATDPRRGAGVLIWHSVSAEVGNSIGHPTKEIGVPEGPLCALLSAPFQKLVATSRSLPVTAGGSASRTSEQGLHARLPHSTEQRPLLLVPTTRTAACPDRPL